jgi:diacylglycerol kinase (ATP)
VSFLRIFPRVFKGTHTTDPRVVMKRAKRIRIEADAALVAYADGERIGRAPVDVQLVPGVLRVLAPAPAP